VVHLFFPITYFRTKTFLREILVLSLTCLAPTLFCVTLLLREKSV
jgi:hypothetical protein